MHHPWRELRAQRHLDVRWQDLGDDSPHGLIVACQITLTTGLTQVERRCALTHELIHHERGIPEGDDPDEERAVEREVARRLIPLDRLICVAKLGLDVHAAADELWVRPDLVRVRLESITHPAERVKWRAAVEEIADAGC